MINIKKGILYFLIVILIFIMSGCTDFYSGKRPIDYGLAKWVSESPDMWFIVNDPYPEYIAPKGEMIVEGQVISFDLYFGGRDAFFSTGDQRLFSGRCKFHPEKLIVEVYKDKARDRIFDGKVDEITFIRTPIEE